MKIAFINQPLDSLVPPHQNSIGIWTYKVAPYLAMDHPVTVFGQRPPNPLFRIGRDRVRYHFIPAIDSARALCARLEAWRDRLPNPRLPEFASRLYYYPEYALQVALQLRRHHPDIIHIHNLTQFVPMMREFHPSAKIVLHMNCEWLSQLESATMARRAQQCDLILGSSEYITEKILGRFPELEERCRTVYNGVDAVLFTPGRSGDGMGTASGTTAAVADPPRLLFVGRVSPEKGVHLLLEAFARVAATHPTVHLDIAGPIRALPLPLIIGVSTDPLVQALSSFYPEDYEAQLRRRIPPQLEGRVHFLGRLSQLELVACYRRATILVNPSLSESFGMSLVEALACEKPVVATRVGGMPTIVGNDDVGLLVPPGEVEPLAAGIRTLLRDPARRLAMGRKGRARVLERFAWPRVAKKLLEHYDALLLKPSRGRS